MEKRKDKSMVPMQGALPTQSHTLLIERPEVKSLPGIFLFLLDLYISQKKNSEVKYFRRNLQTSSLLDKTFDF